MKIRKAKKYAQNPSIPIVMFLLKDSKRTLRTKSARIGRVKGKVSEIITEEREKVFTDSSPFIKFFLDSDSLNDFIGLSKGSQIVLAYIVNTKLELGKDWFYWDTNLAAGKLEKDYKYVWKEFSELLKNEWIYRANESGKFWINLCFISYGKREEIVKDYINVTK